MAKLKMIEMEEFVTKYHVTEKGEQRSLTPPKRENGLWSTRLANGRKIRGKTREQLIVNLYEHYSSLQEETHIIDGTIKTIFPKALLYRVIENGICENTIQRHWVTYRGYLKALENRDIRDISKLELKTYLHDITISKQLTVSEFKQLKGTLSVIWAYASDDDIHLVPKNLVRDISNKAYIPLCVMKQADEINAFSYEQVEQIRKECRTRVARQYDVNAYAILFSSYTGARISEIPTIRWSDIHEKYIHVHSMLEFDRKTRTYTEKPYTKNERKIIKGGRKFFLFDELRTLLDEIKTKQVSLGIESDYVFVKADSSMININIIDRALRRLCEKLGLPITNNHAFRKAVNIDMIQHNIPTYIRARMLGHSIRTNEQHYSEIDDSWLDDTLALYE